MRPWCRDDGPVNEDVEGIVDRFLVAGAGFEQTLRLVRAHHWHRPTPCAAWDVRALVNHVTRGNINYVRLLGGGTAADFLRLRDADALGTDPVGAFTGSVAACAAAFAEPGALRRRLDYPLGRASGGQLLAVRTTDTLIHTWDLARAIGTDENLDGTLVSWAVQNFAEIYRGLAETPTDPNTTHRFFGAAGKAPNGDMTEQCQLLHRTGRSVTPPS
jgi:uncharacterized protein (TIGR03086 family)